MRLFQILSLGTELVDELFLCLIMKPVYMRLWMISHFAYASLIFPHHFVLLLNFSPPLTSYISSDHPLHASLFLPITFLFMTFLLSCIIGYSVSSSSSFLPSMFAFCFPASPPYYLTNFSLCYSPPVFSPHRCPYCGVLNVAPSLRFPTPSLLTMYIQCTALVLSPSIMNVPLCLLLPEPDSYLIFSLRQQL